MGLLLDRQIAPVSWGLSKTQILDPLINGAIYADYNIYYQLINAVTFDILTENQKRVLQ